SERKPEVGRGQLEVAAHRQAREADIDAVDVGQDVGEYRERQQTQIDLAHCRLFDSRFHETSLRRLVTKLPCNGVARANAGVARARDFSLLDRGAAQILADRRSRQHCSARNSGARFFTLRTKMDFRLTMPSASPRPLVWRIRAALGFAI